MTGRSKLIVNSVWNMLTAYGNVKESWTNKSLSLRERSKCEKKISIMKLFITTGTVS